MTTLAVIIAAGMAGCAQPEWMEAEAPLLTGHVELTVHDKFVKAGESYFSPDGQWIIFQAVPVPGGEAMPDQHYSMYVAQVQHDAGGAITGLGEPILVSPPGSWNSCGWFHPIERGTVLFSSTLTPPNTEQKNEFEVRRPEQPQRRYVWMFPQEAQIVTRIVPEMTPTVLANAQTPQVLFDRPDYDAEASWSRDGRYVLYANVRPERTEGRPDADIWLFDVKDGRHTPLVQAVGYDGGPFFSPDERFICYRSDRALNDLLQIYVAELKFDAAGTPVGIEREHQLTDNGSVNWAPFWHPSGKFLVYGSSEVGHHNYEVFAVEFDEAKLKAGAQPASLRRQRLTHAAGADVLPVFSPDGAWMMWTAQRGRLVEGESRPSSQVWAAKFDPARIFADETPPQTRP